MNLSNLFFKYSSFNLFYSFSQVVNASSTPVTKIRAVSPGCARPQQQHTKVVTAIQPPQLLLTPRVPSLGARPPPPPAHNNHNISLDRGVGRQRIRVRAPIVHHHNQTAHQPRPSTIVTASRTVPPPSINTQQVKYIFYIIIVRII